MLIAELKGLLEPADLASALKKLGEFFPALSAHIHYSSLLHRPFWHIEENEQFDRAIEYDYHEVDPQHDDTWSPFNRAMNDPVNVQAGPQLRLVHVRMGQDLHRLGLRWAHPLMDLEGGHVLLGALHDLLCERTPTLNPDPRAVFPQPFRASFPIATLRTWQGKILYALHDGMRQPRIVSKPDNASQTCRFLVRTYSADQRNRFETQAKNRAAPGPYLYSRAILVALARAYHKMSTQRGRPRPHYLFPLPLPLPRTGPRPGVCGNYVSIPWINFAAKDLVDWSKADLAAGRQFKHFFKRHRDQAMWYMYRAFARWPVGITRAFMRHRRPRAAAGFTGYPFDHSVTHLGSAEVTNLTAAGPMDCHPGWMVAKTTFGSGMSLSITYFEDFFDTENVERFFDLLEQELFAFDH